jgi:hypothetical protein
MKPTSKSEEPHLGRQTGSRPHNPGLALLPVAPAPPMPALPPVSVSALANLLAKGAQTYPVTRGNALREATLVMVSGHCFKLTIYWRDLLDQPIEVTYDLHSHDGDAALRRKSQLEPRMIGWAKQRFADYFAE